MTTGGGLSHAAAAELPAVEALDDRTDKPTPACPGRPRLDGRANRSTLRTRALGTTPRTSSRPAPPS